VSQIVSASRPTFTKSHDNYDLVLTSRDITKSSAACMWEALKFVIFSIPVMQRFNSSTDLTAAFT